jgi:hypothetical protein
MVSGVVNWASPVIFSDCTKTEGHGTDYVYKTKIIRRSMHMACIRAILLQKSAVHKYRVEAEAGAHVAFG